MPKVVRTASEVIAGEKPAQVTGSLMADQAAKAAKQEVPVANITSSVPAPAPEGFETPQSEPEADSSVTSAAVLDKAQDPQPQPEQPVTAKSFRFVKNINTNEKIVFDDGTTFQFRNSLFVTENEALAKKLLAVASRYHIVQ